MAARKRRDRMFLPGIPKDTARVIIERDQAFDERLRALERKEGRPGIVTSDVSARIGEFLNIEGQDSLITVSLPESTQARRNGRVTMAFRNSKAVRIVAIAGTVNGAAFVLNDRPGTYDAIADGLGGWAVQVGVSEEGSGAGGGGGSVSTDLAGLSVLGRAGPTTGAMAAITATAGRQVLRNNDAGTALEWGNPIEAQLNDVDLGDVHTINQEAGRLTVSSGIATFDRPEQVNDTQGGTLNAYVLPATLVHGDQLSLIASSSIILNGINSTTVPAGFQFFLNFSNGGVAGRTLTFNDESASAGDALYRLSLPADLQMVLATGSSLIIRRAATRWAVYDASLFRIQDDGVTVDFARVINALSTTSVTATAAVSSGVASLSYQRAALTGFAAAAANSNATTSAEPIITYATSANMSAERVATDTATIDVDIGTASQVRWNVILSAAYAWTGNHSWSGSADFTFNTSGDFDVTTAAFGAVSSSTMLLQATGDISLTTSGNVSVSADALHLTGDGFLLLDAAAASTPSLTANQGMFWSYDPGAPATRPMFTNDSNEDFELFALAPARNELTAGNNSFLGPAFIIYRDVTSSGVAAAGDTQIFSAAPFDMTVVAVGVRPTTSIGGSSVTLRDATGGGGNAVSSAMTTAVGGVVALSTGFTGVVQIAAGTPLVARWSDRTTAGRIWMVCVRD